MFLIFLGSIIGSFLGVLVGVKYFNLSKASTYYNYNYGSTPGTEKSVKKEVDASKEETSDETPSGDGNVSAWLFGSPRKGGLDE